MEPKKLKNEEQSGCEGGDDKGAVQLVGEACNFHKPGEHDQLVPHCGRCIKEVHQGGEELSLPGWNLLRF